MVSADTTMEGMNGAEDVQDDDDDVICIGTPEPKQDLISVDLVDLTEEPDDILDVVTPVKSPTTTAVDINPVFNTIRDILPDADPTFLQRMINNLTSDADLHDFILHAVREKNYPKVNEHGEPVESAQKSFINVFEEGMKNVSDLRANNSIASKEIVPFSPDTSYLSDILYTKYLNPFPERKVTHNFLFEKYISQHVSRSSTSHVSTSMSESVSISVPGPSSSSFSGPEYSSIPKSVHISNSASYNSLVAPIYSNSVEGTVSTTVTQTVSGPVTESVSTPLQDLRNLVSTSSSTYTSAVPQMDFFLNSKDESKFNAPIDQQYALTSKPNRNNIYDLYNSSFLPVSTSSKQDESKYDIWSSEENVSTPVSSNSLGYPQTRINLTSSPSDIAPEPSTSRIIQPQVFQNSSSHQDYKRKSMVVKKSALIIAPYARPLHNTLPRRTMLIRSEAINLPPDYVKEHLQRPIVMSIKSQHSNKFHHSNKSHHSKTVHKKLLPKPTAVNSTISSYVNEHFQRPTVIVNSFNPLNLSSHKNPLSSVPATITSTGISSTATTSSTSAHSTLNADAYFPSPISIPNPQCATKLKATVISNVVENNKHLNVNDVPLNMVTHPPNLNAQHSRVDPHPWVADAHTTFVDAHTTFVDAHTSVADAYPSVADAHPSVADAYPSVADAHPSVADAHPSVADAQPLIAKAKSLIANVEYRNVNTPPLIVNALPLNIIPHPPNVNTDPLIQVINHRRDALDRLHGVQQLRIGHRRRLSRRRRRLLETLQLAARRTNGYNHILNNIKFHNNDPTPVSNGPSDERFKLLSGILFGADPVNLRKEVTKIKDDEEMSEFLIRAFADENSWNKFISLEGSSSKTKNVHKSRYKILMELLPDASPTFLKRASIDFLTNEEIQQFAAKHSREQNYPKRKSKKVKSSESKERNGPGAIVLTQPQNPTFLTLIDMLPDADPHYLFEQSKVFTNQSDVESFVLKAVEEKNYPKKEQLFKRQEYLKNWKKYIENVDIKEFLLMFPNPINYFYIEKKNSKNPLNIPLRFLQHRYRRKNANIFDAIFKQTCHSLVKTCDRLDAHFSCAPRMYTSWDGKSIFSTSTLQEIAFIQNRREIAHYLLFKKTARAEAFEKAKADGTLQECGCCYEEKIPEDMVQCNGMHSFCTICVKRGSDVAIGNGGTTFPCYSDDCKEEFPLSVIQKILCPEVFSRLLIRKQYEEVNAAGIPGLETCVFCEFCSIPSPEDKLFRCMNPACMIITCRSCKKLDHLPLSCEEFHKRETQHKMLNYVEEKMTEALVRTCWKCGAKFVKESGCNMMHCKCGAKMCYQCREPIEDYNHFGQGRCNQNLDTTVRDETNVRDVGKKAKQEVEAANPGFQLADDLTKVLTNNNNI